MSLRGIKAFGGHEIVVAMASNLLAMASNLVVSCYYNDPGKRPQTVCVRSIEV